MYSTFQQKTLYICDLQYTRNTVITKDWTYDEINPHAKRYAPINVMPHYHLHGLRWGKVGICTLGKYKSQLTGAAVLV